MRSISLTTNISHASELALQPDFQILRRYRRPLLLRLEHTHRSTLEDHVHRATRLGSSRSLNLRIGIRPQRVSHQSVCDASTRKVPNIPKAARVARKPCHQVRCTRLRRTTCLPSQKSPSVVGSIPRRARPSSEIGRTPDGQVGGGSIMEYRTARISSQVFVMLLSSRAVRSGST